MGGLQVSDLFPNITGAGMGTSIVLGSLKKNSKRRKRDGERSLRSPKVRKGRGDQSPLHTSSKCVEDIDADVRGCIGNNGIKYIGTAVCPNRWEVDLGEKGMRYGHR